MEATVQIVDYIAPFASGALGIGIAYGILKNSIENLKERVIRMEGVVAHQVGEARCANIRAVCQSNLHEDIMEIKTDLRTNRDHVSKELTEIARFMGRVNGSHTIIKGE